MILFCLFANITWSQNNIPDSLVPFHVIYYCGDEAIVRYDLDIFMKGGEYYAENPSIVYKNKSYGKWITKMNSKKIKACIDFLYAAKHAEKDCLNESSLSEDYYVIIGNDTTKIFDAGCKWDSMTFFRLNSILFKKQFDEQAIKIDEQIKMLQKQLTGRWYYSMTKPLKQNDKLVLTKANTNKSKCYWDIGNKGSFKSNCNAIMNYEKSVSCEILLQNNTLFIINPGVNYGQDGTTIANQGATFELLKNDNKTMVLKYWWE